MGTALDAVYFNSSESTDQTKSVSNSCKRASYDGETRDRRVQLLMKPSLFQKLEMYADSKGISRNAAIEKILLDYLDKKSTE